MVISSPSKLEFKSILNYISKFELDDRDLTKEQFLIIKNNSELIGFGRIRKHAYCDELCSLGIIKPERDKGFGRQLTKALINNATQPLYLVCIIPDFFAPLSFETVKIYPKELQEKLDYCTSELIVPEKYVVMKFTNVIPRN